MIRPQQIGGDEQFSFRGSVGLVELQQTDRYTPDCRERHDLAPDKLKMIRPTV